MRKILGISLGVLLLMGAATVVNAGTISTQTKVTGVVTQNATPVPNAPVTAFCNGDIRADVADDEGGYLINFPADPSTDEGRGCPAGATVRVVSQNECYNTAAGGTVKSFTPKFNMAVTDVALTKTKANFTAITAFQLPRSRVYPFAGTYPSGITNGPDGNLWFTQNSGNAIGKITPIGNVTVYPLPQADSRPWDIAPGPDGNLWFTESNIHKIGKITTAGTVTEYTLPFNNARPIDITKGPEGSMWFVEEGANKIGKITMAGKITEYPIRTPASEPWGIATGADGNMWFTESNESQIGKITLAGVVTEYALPTRGDPEGITAGPDGNLWFAEYNSNRISKITTAGVITQFPALTHPSAGPREITTGADGNLWFTEEGNSSVGRITPAGKVSEFYNPPTGNEPIQLGITNGPDGNIWFTEANGGNRVERVNLACAK